MRSVACAPAAKTSSHTHAATSIHVCALRTDQHAMERSRNRTVAEVRVVPADCAAAASRGGAAVHAHVDAA